MGKLETTKKKHRFFKAALYILKKIATSKYAKKKFLSKYVVSEIGDNAYRITEALLANCYLFVGDNQALLIDTGIGAEGLLEKVKEITKKPLIVVATHAHPFAVGGAGEFPSVLVHKNDLKDAKRYNKYKLRRLVYKLLPTRYILGLTEDSLVETVGNFQKIPKGKTEFDLGGRSVKIIHTPSHTKGSCCFEDSKTGIVVTGDVTLPVSVMVLPHSTTMSVYAESMNRLITHLSTGENYSSFGYKALSYERSYDLKDLADEAVAYGNDYTRLLKIRFSDDKRRMVIYFPAKTIRRKLRDRLYLLR